MTAPKKRKSPPPRPTAAGRRNPRIRAQQDALVLASGWIVDVFVRNYRTSPAGEDDLRQEGWIGLLRAAETFDPCRGFKFSTYAIYWVRSYVQRAHDRAVAEVAPMNRYALEEDDHGHRHYAHHVAVRFDEPEHVDDEHETRLNNTASSGPTPEEAYAAWEECDILGALIDEACVGMDPRLAIVARERLKTPDAKTLHDVGVMLGISREWVRLLEGRLIGAVRAVASVTLTPGAPSPVVERRRGERRRQPTRA